MNKFRLIIGVLLVALLAYLGYVNWPRPRTINYTVYKPVSETRTSNYTTTIQVDGNPREVTVPVPNTIVHMVPETKSRSVLPAAKEYLQVAVIVLMIAFVVGYLGILLFAFGRDKLAGGRISADKKDTHHRLDKVVSLVFVFILGFASGGGKLTNKPTALPNNEEVQPSDDPIPSANEVPPPVTPAQQPSPVGDPGPPQV